MRVCVDCNAKYLRAGLYTFSFVRFDRRTSTPSDSISAGFDDRLFEKTEINGDFVRKLTKPNKYATYLKNVDYAFQLTNRTILKYDKINIARSCFQIDIF